MSKMRRAVELDNLKGKAFLVSLLECKFDFAHS